MFDLMIDMMKRCDIEVLKAFLNYYGKVVDERQGNLTLTVSGLNVKKCKKKKSLK